MTNADDARLVASRYSEQAEAYRRHWAPQLFDLGSVLLERLPVSEANAVLEVGAGVGALLAEIRRRATGAAVVGADIAEGMIRLAPPDIPRVVANAAALPFRDEGFDVAVMAFMLFHVPEPSDAVREIRRVVRRGGEVGVATWGPGLNDTPADQVWAKVLDELGAPEETDAVARHDLTDSAEKVAALFATAGFAVAHQEERVNVDRTDPEEFVKRRTTLGREHRRLRKLDPNVQAEVVRVGRERLRGLGPDDFIARETAILTVLR
ncbi:MAG TPA: class I SAM-dependent methyltransferase [Actinomycetota bacterium]|nr:class I SAM-dependent methyltransferase [Actinomycetota bacterium]